MDRIDLRRVDDRLKIARRVFAYPEERHQRRHGPSGYKTYESYREWLRDEFSYRCVFSLIREQWIGRKANFDIDHLESQSLREDLVCNYDNLLYLAHRTNLVRGNRPLPDPCKVALGKCLAVDPDTGEIRALNDVGGRIISVLKLDSLDATEDRLKWLRILRCVAQNDEALFRQLIGYPTDNLRDLSKTKVQVDENSRPNGIAESAFERKRLGTLPDWY